MTVSTPDYTHISLGCSHTRAVYLPQENRWQHIVQKETGSLFEYRYASKIATGLVHLEKRLETIPLDNTKFVLIQKPQPIRFPWWIENWKDLINQSSYGRLDLVKGRKYSMKVFNRLPYRRQKEIAEQIFDEELQCLARLRRLFPDARMAYYYYWGDCILDQLHRPNIAHVNAELGENLADLNIENWGTIIDPKTIPGAYDEEGDILMDLDTLFKSGWTASITDQHPGLKFHELVARKVLEWLSH